ncbi:venom carboxylesterase-6-like [Anthonomus grandis grandis]|uniref:venom carboxylesterase-6-like n=1 Tax=Anthonomus grandis grandis TaxID=2921223 RepID=UPI00216567AC|nr:venom carboxylesterase-6-like [Anthonomus grandis grandis]
MRLQIALLFLTFSSKSLGNILATTQKGTVRGRSIQSPANRTFYAFTGIPFAKPPLGKLRFQAPIEVEPWDGIKDATEDPNKCFQVNSDSDTESEDCLYANVFTAALDLVNSTKKLPVVLSIYGGAFRSGSAGYGKGGPDWFIERDIIYVTFNYRVGPFGFLSTNDLVIPGNAGLKDQQLALKWTYENIEFFGGNKSHITIHGQSAGAASVTYQLLNPKTQGLIVGALAESGSAFCPWAWLKDNTAYTINLARIVNNNTEPFNTSSTSLLKLLQQAPARAIDAASGTLYSHSTSNIPLPTLEPQHDGAFITEPMYELLDAGRVVKVPLFIGINSEEEIGMSKNIPNLQSIAKKFDSNYEALLPWQLKSASEENRTIAANLLKEAYVGNDTFTNHLGKVIAYTSDAEFTRSIIRFGEMYARFSPVYFYQFSYKGPWGINTFDYIDGADNVSHGEETRYISVLKVGSYDNTKYDEFPASDVLTHMRMIKLWSNFYKFGNPTPEPIDLLSNITWPTVSENAFTYLHINTTLELKDTPKSPKYNAWRSAFLDHGVRPLVIF